eukprot:CAMPEP_0198510896 /NCGR_PEP_ID=MMETSP1462-20131121/14473_1 /TAXON_ID=1333877 /ORGANISM="Brandtodinium nutriculum, Strain RCC3387" /LENGTH=193 /DNA_ID=CAMNT_0044240245 /DNA_START=145 /DNA_END=722 /DNA_ORIENTATION=-
MKYDAEDFADEVTGCCGVKLRTSVFTVSVLYAAIGLAYECMLMVWGEKLFHRGGRGHTVSTALLCCMLLASVTGFVGAFWRVTYPLTLCVFVIRCMMMLSIAWIFTATYDQNKGWNGLKDASSLLWASLLAGTRPASMPAASHLILALISLVGHSLARSAAGDYALVLRQCKHAELFEVLDSDDEETAPLLKA